MSERQAEIAIAATSPGGVRRACVIGAGFGGLALAIRLQSKGIATTLVEARDRAGGRASHFEREGFVFERGPTALIDPGGLKELWALSGRDMAADVELLPVTPLWRFNWTDGTTFDLTGDEAAFRREIARIAPGDLAGYEEFARYVAGLCQPAEGKLVSEPFLDFASMVRALPTLARQHGWRSVHALVAHFIKHERLREAFSVHCLLEGGNPLTTPAPQLRTHHLERSGGMWCAAGGTNRLIAAMTGHFERLGGTIRLHDPVLHIHTLGDRVSEVESMSGWCERFDAVASNADLVHTYRDMLADFPRGPETARKLASRRYSPGMFVVNFGLEGSWPGIPHNMVLFGPRFKALLEDIFEHGVLPRDFVMFLHHPSVTDPSLAPPGKSTFQAAVPVAHQGKLPIDWEQVGPMLQKRVLEEVGRRLIPDIDDRLVTVSHYSPRDMAMDFNAFRGSAFGLEPVLAQSGWLRPHNRDDRIRNLYLVGSGTHPGAGVPNVLAGARITANLMLEDLRQ